MSIFVRAIVKLVVSILLAVGLVFVLAMVWPQGVSLLQDGAAGLAKYLAAPAFMSDAAQNVYNDAVGPTMVFGILAAVVSRVLIETVAYIAGSVTRKS